MRGIESDPDKEVRGERLVRTRNVGVERGCENYLSNSLAGAQTYPMAKEAFESSGSGDPESLPPLWAKLAMGVKVILIPPCIFH